jgi:hypothetical protein
MQSNQKASPGTFRSGWASVATFHLVPMKHSLRVLAHCLPALGVVACLGRPTEPFTPVLKFAFDSSEHAAWTYSPTSDAYLEQLRGSYSLASVVSGAGTDFEKVQRMSRWVRQRWEHNGDRVASPADPISILKFAEAGQRFRCVEYSIVLSGALNSIGIRSRVVGLKTSDVETRESGAGHVVSEAYLGDQKKWVMVDGQWDVIPMLGARPLSAIELQAALAARDPALGVESLSGASASRYFSWVAEYLYYFDATLDQRTVASDKRFKALMLVPEGAPQPRVFQRKYSIGDVTYTNNAYLFAGPPGG